MVREILRAARLGDLPLVQKMLADGGACITDVDQYGNPALLLAAMFGRLATCQWMLEHGGADIAEANNVNTVWNLLLRHFNESNAAEVTALLRVMVLNSGPPTNVVAQLEPEHVQVVEEGARLRAALPAYLARRRAPLDRHCPLIAPLRNLVREYDPEPITTEEIWATGLGAAPQRARRPRVEALVALPVRQSARLRQQLE
jgi:hypothetical protein